MSKQLEINFLGPRLPEAIHDWLVNQDIKMYCGPGFDPWCEGRKEIRVAVIVTSVVWARCLFRDFSEYFDVGKSHLWHSRNQVAFHHDNFDWMMTFTDNNFDRLVGNTFDRIYTNIVPPSSRENVFDRYAPTCRPFQRSAPTPRSP